MSENIKKFPKYGEIWLACFDPSRGSEQGGTRPALIIQNDIGNEYSSVTIVSAITTNLYKNPVTVLVDKKDSGLLKESAIKLNQIFTMDKERLIKKLGRLSEEKIMEVKRAISVSLNF